MAGINSTSKNSFLMIGTRDFVPNKVLEIPEYFVYFGIFKTHSWGKRSVQIAKGEFAEVLRIKNKGGRVNLPPFLRFSRSRSMERG